MIKIDDIDLINILLSKEETYSTNNSFKYFIGCNDIDVIRALCIKLPRMIVYVRKLEGKTTMAFTISNKQPLKKYNQIWKRVKKLLKAKFDNQPIYDENDKYIKTKIKAYGGSVNTNFQGKKIPKEKAQCKFLC